MGWPRVILLLAAPFNIFITFDTTLTFDCGDTLNLSGRMKYSYSYDILMRGRGITIGLLIVLIIWFVFNHFYQTIPTVYVRSDVDGRSYLVQATPERQNVANLLATIRQNMVSLTDRLYRAIGADRECAANRTFIKTLHERIGNATVREADRNTVETSYTINKGKQIVFCIRSRAEGKSVHSLNLMMYVALHEMAHVACPEFGHTELFNQIFNFLCRRAIAESMYVKIDFDSTPTEYCGMWIRESIV